LQHGHLRQEDLYEEIARLYHRVANLGKRMEAAEQEKAQLMNEIEQLRADKAMMEREKAARDGEDPRDCALRWRVTLMMARCNG